MIYITPKSYEKLRDEYNFLKSVERPKVVNEVSEAAALGDRSENAEYIYGKARLREIDRRLRFLAKNFDQLQIIDPKTPRNNKIYFGATITLYDNDNDTEITYQILGPLDDLDDTHISYKSPVASALLGKQLDDDITVKTPNAIKHFTIINIEYK